MATSQGVVPMTAIAGSAVRLGRFVVQAAGDGQWDEVAGAQGLMQGVALEAQTVVGAAFAVAMANGAIVKVEAGDAITRGARVASDNQGRAIPHVSGAGNVTGGEALDAANGAGEFVRILFRIERDEVT
jgi:hypothetical protein